MIKEGSNIVLWYKMNSRYCLLRQLLDITLDELHFVHNLKKKVLIHQIHIRFVTCYCNSTLWITAQSSFIYEYYFCLGVWFNWKRNSPCKFHIKFLWWSINFDEILVINWLKLSTKFFCICESIKTNWLIQIHRVRQSNWIHSGLKTCTEVSWSFDEVVIDFQDWFSKIKGLEEKINISMSLITCRFICMSLFIYTYVLV